MAERLKCPRCGHAEHRKACPAKGPSGCVPLTGENGLQAGIVCGARPPCPCPWQVCTCGLPVTVAHLDGAGLDAAVEAGITGIGQLAVRELPDGRLACRELTTEDSVLRDGEWVGREHLEWPDHGPIAAKYAKETT